MSTLQSYISRPRIAGVRGAIIPQDRLGLLGPDVEYTAYDQGRALGIPARRRAHTIHLRRGWTLTALGLFNPGGDLAVARTTWFYSGGYHPATVVYCNAYSHGFIKAVDLP